MQFVNVDEGTWVGQVSHPNPKQQRNCRQNFKVDQCLGTNPAQFLDITNVGNPNRQARAE